ncbi:aspartyl-phosphate phosphatase Spo0E family protein [Bacillus sp. UNC41MFS5]|uniref:aspartyl-phosphate phosphatase Spo0E family protein n=1 Tax=Bacillus sp. UNC41MFS5 TaxID=1449046 RepID=UPI00055012CE|nr:aspartyl-phosphate phosphatase Spo0E family protein [Bacillus sp. UNC41MFS5]
MVYTELDKLEHRIKKLRNEMIQSAAATGINSHRTIYYSQKLDKLIMIYQNETREMAFNRNGII